MITALLYSLFALDDTLARLAGEYGPWLYLLLFVLIFGLGPAGKIAFGFTHGIFPVIVTTIAETGLVVFPVLPGDSLLFIAGTVVAVANLNVHVLVAVLATAAILGDSVNYAVGHFIGPRAFERPDSRWLKQAHLRRTLG